MLREPQVKQNYKNCQGVRKKKCEKSSLKTKIIRYDNFYSSEILSNT